MHLSVASVPGGWQANEGELEAPRGAGAEKGAVGQPCKWAGSCSVATVLCIVCLCCAHLRLLLTWSTQTAAILRVTRTAC